MVDSREPLEAFTSAVDGDFPPVRSSATSQIKFFSSLVWPLVLARTWLSISLVAVISQNRDGFKLWYDLMHEFHPQTKQRTLSLAQTLASYPSFAAKQSMLEGILNYETLVDQYDKSSGEKYPSDLKTATLLRCAPQKIREFLQLTLRDDV